MRAVLIALALLGAAPAANGETAVDCADPACEALVSASCLSRVGAGSLSTNDACAAEQSAYIACLARVAETCSGQPSPQSAEGCSAEDARQMFDAVKDSDDPGDHEAFADACPNAPQARLAARRAQTLRADAASRDREAPGAAFLGEWRFKRILSQTDQRLGCTPILRLQRAQGGFAKPWRYGWRHPRSQELIGRADASGAHQASGDPNGALVFDNGARFTLQQGGLVFEAPGIVCFYDRYAG
ncbi:MAG: hypothetical protein AAFW46_04160 [Pseudomonadota bacterium]